MAINPADKGFVSVKGCPLAEAFQKIFLSANQLMGVDTFSWPLRPIAQQVRHISRNHGLPGK